MHCSVEGFPPVRASTILAEITIFPGVACQRIQNRMAATTGNTKEMTKSASPSYSGSIESPGSMSKS